MTVATLSDASSANEADFKCYPSSDAQGKDHKFHVEGSRKSSTPKYACRDNAPGLIAACDPGQGATRLEFVQ